MLIAARYLVDRLRHGQPRAAQVRLLRERLAAQPLAVSPEEIALAQELRRLRQQLSGAIGAVRSCSGCAAGHPEPHGHYAGGHCCGAATEDLFNDDEVAALRLSGTTPGQLRAPLGEQAGCAFRGPTGCSLDAADRPNVCVRYVCQDLQRELHRRGDLPAIESLCAAVEEVYLRFIQARAARLEAAEITEEIAVTG